MMGNPTVKYEECLKLNTTLSKLVYNTKLLNGPASVLKDVLISTIPSVRAAVQCLLYVLRIGIVKGSC